MFFTYRQNNTGGEFIYSHFEGIGEYVIIEADSADEADIISYNKGLYFDGVADGIDCSCCGDRWHRTREDGSEVPSLYPDTPFTEIPDDVFRYVTRRDTYLHRANGVIEKFDWEEMKFHAVT